MAYKQRIILADRKYVRTKQILEA